MIVVDAVAVVSSGIEFTSEPDFAVHDAGLPCETRCNMPGLPCTLTCQCHHRPDIRFCRRLGGVSRKAQAMRPVREWLQLEWVDRGHWPTRPNLPKTRVRTAFRACGCLQPCGGAVRITGIDEFGEIAIRSGPAGIECEEIEFHALLLPASDDSVIVKHLNIIERGQAPTGCWCQAGEDGNSSLGASRTVRSQVIVKLIEAATCRCGRNHRRFGPKSCAGRDRSARAVP